MSCCCLCKNSEVDNKEINNNLLQLDILKTGEALNINGLPLSKLGEEAITDIIDNKEGSSQLKSEQAIKNMQDEIWKYIQGVANMFEIDNGTGITYSFVKENEFNDVYSLVIKTEGKQLKIIFNKDILFKESQEAQDTILHDVWFTFTNIDDINDKEYCAKLTTDTNNNNNITINLTDNENEYLTLKIIDENGQENLTVEGKKLNIKRSTLKAIAKALAMVHFEKFVLVKNYSREMNFKEAVKNNLKQGDTYRGQIENELKTQNMNNQKSNTNKNNLLENNYYVQNQ